MGVAAGPSSMLCYARWVVPEVSKAPNPANLEQKVFHRTDTHTNSTFISIDSIKLLGRAFIQRKESKVMFYFNTEL